MKASKQVGNYSDDAQNIINRQHSALILMSMILDDVRRGYPKLSAELDRIIQQAIDNAGTGPELAERLEQETWMGVDMATEKAARAQQSGEDGKGSLPWFVHVYNSGYQAGHHDTVEGGFTPIHHSDKDTYHEDQVLEILEDLNVSAYHEAPPSDKPKGKCEACGGSGFRSAGDGKIGTWPCEFCERPAAPDMGGINE